MFDGDGGGGFEGGLDLGGGISNAPLVDPIEATWVSQHLRNSPNADVETIRRNLRRVGRNDPCPCGSGLKLKACCRRPKKHFGRTSLENVFSVFARIIILSLTLGLFWILVTAVRR